MFDLRFDNWGNLSIDVWIKPPFCEYRWVGFIYKTEGRWWAPSLELEERWFQHSTKWNTAGEAVQNIRSLFTMPVL